jgi:predicted P-loop ATPase
MTIFDKLSVSNEEAFTRLEVSNIREVESFVKWAFDYFQIQIHKGGLYISKFPVEDKLVAYSLYKIFKKHYRLNKSYVINATREEIELEIRQLKKSKDFLTLAKLKRTLQSEPDVQKFNYLLENLAKYTLGKADYKNNVSKRLFKGFVAHFIWQVMSKLHLGLEISSKVKYEAMLVLYSRSQGTGKTTFIEQLCKPFNRGGFIWRADLDRLSDNFSAGNLTNNYIGLIDEISKMDQKNTAKFKQVVTETEINYREMYSQGERKCEKLCTFIGGTNISCENIFYDTTGLRRFHQIEVRSREEGRMSLKEICAFDFLSLWKSVPLYTDKTPLFDYITQEELSEYEENLRPKDSVEHWLEDLTDFRLLKTKEEDCNFISLQELYDKYAEWCRSAGNIRSFSKPGLSKHLFSLGYTKARNKNARGFYINTTHKKGKKNEPQEIF